VGEPVTAQLTQRAGEGLVPTVGIELSAFKRAKIKNRQNSQQMGQQFQCLGKKSGGEIQSN
jgi:hypothetical protein